MPLKVGRYRDSVTGAEAFVFKEGGPDESLGVYANGRRVIDPSKMEAAGTWQFLSSEVPSDAQHRFAAAMVPFLNDVTSLVQSRELKRFDRSGTYVNSITNAKAFVIEFPKGQLSGVFADGSSMVNPDESTNSGSWQFLSPSVPSDAEDLLFLAAVQGVGQSYVGELAELEDELERRRRQKHEV